MTEFIILSIVATISYGSKRGVVVVMVVEVEMVVVVVVVVVGVPHYRRKNLAAAAKVANVRTETKADKVVERGIGVVFDSIAKGHFFPECKMLFPSRIPRLVALSLDA